MHLLHRCRRHPRHRRFLFRLVLDDDVARYDVCHRDRRRHRRFPLLRRLVNDDDRDNDVHDDERRIFPFWLVVDDHDDDENRQSAVKKR